MSDSFLSVCSALTCLASLGGVSVRIKAVHCPPGPKIVDVSQNSVLVLWRIVLHLHDVVRSDVGRIAEVCICSAKHILNGKFAGSIVTDSTGERAAR